MSLVRKREGSMLDVKKNWLAYLNYYLLQWFCIRLCLIYSTDNSWLGFGIVFRWPLTGWNKQQESDTDAK